MSDKSIALENRPAYVEVLDELLTYHRSEHKNEKELESFLCFNIQFKSGLPFVRYPDLVVLVVIGE